MKRSEAKTLKALIRGLTKTEGQTQYDPGELVLRTEDIVTILDAIDCLTDK